MSTKCVPRRRCGTAVTGWLLETHPTVEEGAVVRQVCFAWKNCCQYRRKIRVRNCGTYFVYQLSPTRDCPMRYCGNGMGKLPSLFLSFCFFSG